MKHCKTLLGMAGLNIQLFAGPKIDKQLNSTNQAISNDILDELQLVVQLSPQILIIHLSYLMF